MRGIFVKSTKEILYLRCDDEKVLSKDKTVKFSKYYTKTTIPNNIVFVELSENKLLSQILYYDWWLKNSNAKSFKGGYYGKFQLNDGSNEQFYKELIVEGFDEVWDCVK